MLKILIIIPLIMIFLNSKILEKPYSESKIEKLNNKKESYKKNSIHKKKNLIKNKYEYNLVNKKLKLIRKKEAIQKEKDKQEAEKLLEKILKKNRHKKTKNLRK